MSKKKIEITDDDIIEALKQLKKEGAFNDLLASGLAKCSKTKKKKPKSK